MNPKFWPYEEVEFIWDEDHSRVLVKSPWMQGHLPIAPSNKSVVCQLLQKYPKEPLSESEFFLLNDLLGPLAKYPLCYSLPVEKPGAAFVNCEIVPFFRHEQASNGFLTLPIEKLVKTALAHNKSTMTAEDLSSFIAASEKKSWDWEIESALSFAQISSEDSLKGSEGALHPESLLTVARRYHLLDVLNFDRGREIFAAIAELNPDQRQQATALLVRQNHYVTTRCQEALLPALSLAGPARAEVHEFIRQENGHDQILEAALKSMGTQPDQIAVTSSAQILMELLKFAATSNFLAFTMAVDFFERSTYQSKDPLAQLVEQNGHRKASDHINRHKLINDAGEHENVALSFLSQMPPVSRIYASEALRIAEAVSVAINSVTNSAWGLFK